MTIDYLKTLSFLKDKICARQELRRSGSHRPDLGERSLSALEQVPSRVSPVETIEFHGNARGNSADSTLAELVSIADGAIVRGARILETIGIAEYPSISLARTSSVARARTTIQFRERIIRGENDRREVREISQIVASSISRV